MREESHARKEPSYQERVVEEKRQLEEKILGLQKFTEVSPIFRELPREEIQDLSQQLMIMEKYSEILRRRINRFSFTEQK